MATDTSVQYGTMHRLQPCRSRQYGVPDAGLGQDASALARSACGQERKLHVLNGVREPDFGLESSRQTKLLAIVQKCMIATSRLSGQRQFARVMAWEPEKTPRCYVQGIALTSST